MTKMYRKLEKNLIYVANQRFWVRPRGRKKDLAKSLNTALPMWPLKCPCAVCGASENRTTEEREYSAAQERVHDDSPEKRTQSIDAVRTWRASYQLWSRLFALATIPTNILASSISNMSIGNKNYFAPILTSTAGDPKI